MAFKLRSPLHQENSKSKFVSNTMNFGDSPELRQDADIPYSGIEDLDAGGVKTNEPAVPEDKEEKSNIDKFIDENEVEEGPRDPNKFLKDRIAQSTNPAQQAKLKGRIARREGRQEERLKKQTKRAEAINVRNFGNKQGLSEMEIADREAASFDKEAALIEQEAKLNRKLKESPTKMTVNRAGRSKESGVLMTSPVIKTGKHSNKDAVAKMKMQNIAQTPLFQSIQYSEPPTAAEEKARAAGFKKAHPELYTKEAMAKDKAQGRYEAERKAYNSEGMESELSFED